jgi:hypothetical protein
MHIDLHRETEFLTAVLVKNQVFWDMPYTLAQQSKGLLLELLHPREVGSYLPVDTP